MLKERCMKTPTSYDSPQLRLTAARTAARHNAFSFVGAGLGVVLFLAIALLPSLVYGGVASVQLASGLFGASGAPTIGISAFIVLGMVIAVTSTGSLFTALGAVAGASVATLTRSPRGRR
jgi:uncharacterized RDD family membrane protein YckC